jgi:hypothetical protein
MTRIAHCCCGALRAEVTGQPTFVGAPADAGELKAIVVRPAHGVRRDVESVKISLAGGVEGYHWAKKCWKETADGRPHPDAQICIMNARAIALIAGTRENWPAAGDNLYIDVDLSPENLPPRTRLTLGSATIEITAVPHNGCQNFIDRYGRDACVFVNTGEGKKLRLRGIYARVVKDGRVAVGDRAVEAGILPHVCLDHGLTMSFYYVDPDGNSVELQSDNFGNWIQSSHWMQTSREFAREPIGAEVDPPKMIKALKSGVSLSDLLKKTRAGEFLPETRGDVRLPL